MQCKNCGKELNGDPLYCPNCGVAVIESEARKIKGGKSKTVALLLAFFLSFWTWLYTYKKDAWKFWTGAGLWLINIGLIIYTLGFWLLFIWIIGIPVWIWAVVDVARKQEGRFSSC